MSKILKVYRCPSTTVAFLDGIFLSTAINLLTGINSYSGLSLWLMLISILFMIVGTIVLFLFQNSASNLQEGYTQWKFDREEHNIAFPEEANSFPTDWLSFVELSTVYYNYFLNTKDCVEKKYELEKKHFQNCHYSKRNLYLKIFFSFLPLLISIAFMIVAMCLSN